MTGRLHHGVVGLPFSDGDPHAILAVGAHGHPGVTAVFSESGGLLTEAKPDEVGLTVGQGPALVQKCRVNARPHSSPQAPPIPSGKRITFVTLEDGSGLIDLAFFEDSHERCAHTIFHSGLLLVRGTVEARGPRRTVLGEMVWYLDAMAATRRDHGPQAALDLLGRTALSPTPAQPSTPADAGETKLGRVLQDGTAGSKMHAWADIQPAGSRSADVRRLVHRSPGSPDH